MLGSRRELCRSNVVSAIKELNKVFAVIRDTVGDVSDAVSAARVPNV
jgi:hypothetical protein